MKILTFSDSHIWKDKDVRIIQALAAKVEERNPDILIAVGDIDDPWKSTWPDIIGSPAHQELESIIRRRIMLGKRVVVLRRNHDWNARPTYLPGAEMVRRFKVGNWEFRHGDEFCYDAQTEVLTEAGWRYFADLNQGTRIATLIGNQIIYEYPLAITHLSYKGKMYHATSSQLDLMVTPNHHLYVRKRRWKDYSPFVFAMPAEIMGKRPKFRKGGVQWKGSEKATELIASNEISMDIWLEFMGYYLSEGYTNQRRGQQFTIGVCQSPRSEHYEKIWKCLSQLPFGFRTTRVGFVSYHLNLGSYLKRFGKSYQKHVPPEMKALSSRQLRILFDALIIGDGNHTKRGYAYTTVSRQLADDIQEIGLKLGYGTNSRVESYIGRNAPCGPARHDMYRIGFFSIETETVLHSGNKRPATEEWVDYDGYVYCCTVSSHVIMVRRNGKTVWCGNSMDWAIIGPAIFWLSTHLPQLMVPIYHLLYKTPTQLKPNEDSWNWGIGMIHLRAEIYARKHKTNLLIGHTHSPMRRHLGKSLFLVDGGDLEDSLSLCEIELGKPPKILWLKL